jgi:hypothetical protein
MKARQRSRSAEELEGQRAEGLRIGAGDDSRRIESLAFALR